MPLGYEYKRYFIILQEEDKGYAMTAGKIPTGYVKIEIKKNKVKIGGFIQNMKSDDKSKYKLNLLAPKEKRILDIGLFRMDNSGRGEFYAEFDSDNVYNSNIPISEFTGALVVAGSGVPLVGYSGRESIPWRDWYNTSIRESAEVAEELPRIEEKEEVKVVEMVPEARIEEIIEPKEDRKEADVIPGEAGIEERHIEDEIEVEIKEERYIEEDKTEEERYVEDAEQAEQKREEEDRDEIDKSMQPKEAAPMVETDMTDAGRMVENIYYVDEDEARDRDIIEENIMEDVIKNDEMSRENIENMEMRAEPAPLYYEEPEKMERLSFHETDMSNLLTQPEAAVRHDKKEETTENKVSRELHNIVKNMERFDDFHSQYGIRWYRIGKQLPLLNDVIIPMNGAMMPLSYPYISETNGRNIRNSLLGIEYRRGEIRYVYIGIPGMYNEACKPCYEYRGFSGYRRTKSGARGYWIMCIDIVKGKLCRI